MKIYRKTFENNSYVEDEDVGLLPDGGVLSEIDISDRIRCDADGEVDILRGDTTLSISKFVSKWVERKVILGADIPDYIMEQYEDMKSEYHQKKQAIYSRYNLTN